MKNGPKWSLGAPRIDLFFVFIDFWRRRKKNDFSMRFWGDQKIRKIDPWSAKGSKNAPRVTTTNGPVARGVTALASKD